MPVRHEINDVPVTGFHYQDLVISGTSVNPPGIVNAPTYNTTLLTTDFQAGQQNRFDIIYQSPHSIVLGPGADGNIHLHAQGDGSPAGNARLEVSTAAYPSSMAGSAQPAFTTTNVDLAIPADTLERMYVIHVPNMNLVGMSGIVKCKIVTRLDLPGYTGTLRVSSYDMHVRVNSFGSRTEGAK